MISRLAAFTLAVGALAAPAQAQLPALPPAPPAAAKPLHTLPFELYDGRIYIEAEVGGAGPKTFLVDTGAQLTHLSAELVREAGLETFGGLGITGTGRGRIGAEYARLNQIQLGGLSLPVNPAASAPAEALFGPVMASSGKRFDGILGYDLFAAYVVEVDYLARRIMLHDPATYTAAPEADLVPIEIVDNKPYLTATVSLPGRAVEGVFLLDTGSGGAIGFNGDFVAERDLLASAGPTVASISRGVGGTTPARLGRAQWLTIGRTSIAGPFATFALAQGSGVAGHSAGRVGGALLRRFTLTINYPARTIALLPNANFNRPLETDMSGLGLAHRNGSVEVVRVEEGSAADEAGIKAGDRLLGIDGRTASELNLEALRAMLMEHGAVRRLAVLRGKRTLDIPLRLRRRI
jgi:hypothetical protein